jgi:hypothetical protein
MWLSNDRLHVKVVAKIHFSGHRALDDVIGATAGEDLAVVHDIGEIADLQGFPDVVVGDQNPQSLCVSDRG